MDFFGSNLLSVNNLVIDHTGLIENIPFDEISGRLIEIHPIYSFPAGRLRRLLFENSTNFDSGQKYWKYLVSIWDDLSFDWILGKNYRISNFKLKFRQSSSSTPGLFQSFIILTKQSSVTLIDD